MISKLLKFFKTNFKLSPDSREELVEVLQQAVSKQLFDQNSLTMIENVLEVPELQVRDIMVVKSEMVTISLNSSLNEILELIVSNLHSRYPVVDEDDDVKGILLAKDLLKYWNIRDLTDFDIKQIIRTPVFIPESKRLDTLLQDFRIKRNHMAIVVNEYGNITGLATIEDILEQIVGDISDEYDEDDDSEFIKNIKGNLFRVRGHTKIEYFNKYFSKDIECEQVETIAGLIIKEYGKMPKRNAILTIKGLQFKILGCDERKIDWVQYLQI